MNLESRIAYIKALSESTLEGVFNPWRDVCQLDLFGKDSPVQRAERLLSHISIEKPLLIACGEAPGYQGCRYSGIPFTSEALLMKNAIPRVSIHQQPRLTSRRLPWKEPSATIVWSTLYNLDIAERVILSNAFPFHPYKPGLNHSNRTPTPTELTAGGPFLQQLINIFPNTPLVAIGNSAQTVIQSLGINPDVKVRHPANGGATKFKEELNYFVQNLTS